MTGTAIVDPERLLTCMGCGTVYDPSYSVAPSVHNPDQEQCPTCRLSNAVKRTLEEDENHDQAN